MSYEEEDLRLPPQSVEAEQSILGSMMIDNRCIDDVCDLINADNFYRSDHRLIFDAVVSITSDGGAADVVTVSEKLTKNGKIDQVGGLAYIGTIAKNTPSSSNVKSYAKIVRERAILRGLIEASNDISQAAYSLDGKTTDQVVDMAERMIYQISSFSTSAVNDSKLIREVLTGVVDKIEYLFKSKIEIVGTETGFIDIDKSICGLDDGDLIIVAGRPSMGKTSFAMNIVEHVGVKIGSPAFVASMEMSEEKIVNRMLASIGKVALSRLKNGQLDNDDWPKLTSAIGLLTEAKW